MTRQFIIECRARKKSARRRRAQEGTAPSICREALSKKETKEIEKRLKSETASSCQGNCTRFHTSRDDATKGKERHAGDCSGDIEDPAAIYFALGERIANNRGTCEGGSGARRSAKTWGNSLLSKNSRHNPKDSGMATRPGNVTANGLPINQRATQQVQGLRSTQKRIA